MRSPYLAMLCPYLAILCPYLGVRSLFVTMPCEGAATIREQSRDHRALRPMLPSSRKARWALLAMQSERVAMQSERVAMQSERVAMRRACLGVRSWKLAMPWACLEMRSLDLGMRRPSRGRRLIQRLPG